MKYNILSRRFAKALSMELDSLAKRPSFASAKLEDWQTDFFARALSTVLDLPAKRPSFAGAKLEASVMRAVRSLC